MRKFEYGYDSVVNISGVTETKFWIKGICPCCKEKTTASVIIPKTFNDCCEIQNFTCICDSCNKKFVVNNEIKITKGCERNRRNKL